MGWEGFYVCSGSVTMDFTIEPHLLEPNDVEATNSLLTPHHNTTHRTARRFPPESQYGANNGLDVSM